MATTSSDSPWPVDDRRWCAESGSRISQVDLSLLRRLYASLGPARAGSDVIGADVIRSMTHRDLRLHPERSSARVFEFDAGPFTLVVEVVPDGTGGFLIQGQVLHAEGGGFVDARIILDPGFDVVRVGLVSGEGEFRIQGLDPAVYRMLILTGSARIVVEHLTIR
jgi:hypothetical protein